MAHVKPLSRDEVPQFRDRFEQYAKTRGFVPNSLLTMSRRPAIAEAFMELNRAALRLAWKGATAPNQTTAADFEELRKHFDDGQIVEIVATIALFGYLNRWNDTMATDLEERPLGVAARTIAGSGWTAGKHFP